MNDPLIPLDRDNAIMSRVPVREDTKEFVARMWNIEAQVAERLHKVAEYDALTLDERSRITQGIKVGGKVWLSAQGITMPWDRHRPSKKLNARYQGWKLRPLQEKRLYWFSIPKVPILYGKSYGMQNKTISKIGSLFWP